jgi:hypothetical protein
MRNVCTVTEVDFSEWRYTDCQAHRARLPSTVTKGNGRAAAAGKADISDKKRARVSNVQTLRIIRSDLF